MISSNHTKQITKSMVSEDQKKHANQIKEKKKKMTLNCLGLVCESTRPRGDCVTLQLGLNFRVNWITGGLVTGN